MSKLVVLNLGKGDLKNGFPAVTFQLWEDSNPIPMQSTGGLPAAPELSELYRRWHLLYHLLYEAVSLRKVKEKLRAVAQDDIEIDEEDVTNISSIEFGNLCDELQNKMNAWLKSKPFRNIDQKLRTKLAPTDEVRVTIVASSDLVRRLPWHLWDLFEDYQKAVFCLSTPEVDRVQSLRKQQSKQIRILAILGNSEGIDVLKDRQMLEQLPEAQTVFLVEPQRQELNRWLWDKQGWDILFFAGHSVSGADGETGVIYINQTDSLTIPQLKNALKAAIARGLTLAIFNSCDGLGLANQLASLHIPQMIVMKESVPDVVAQEFLKYFLEALSEGESFYLAVREAGERLQGMENEFPCASWLPVVCQNPTEAPLVWLQRTRTGERDRSTLPMKRLIPAILQMSVLLTTLVVGMRSLGMLQLWEFLTFDTLMRLRPDEGPDSRLLIIKITEADVQSQPAKERGSASLSDRSLAQLIEKLESFQPRVIGLDIYRENPVSPKYRNLANTMKNSDRFISICKASEDSQNAGVAPPPEVPVQRQGFSDVILDPDSVVRRQILAMAPASPCNTDKSFSFQLATRYLTQEGIQTKLTPEQNWKIGNVTFRDLENNSGGYQGIDSRGHQVMLNYRSTSSIATQVTLTDFLNNKINPDLVKNRIVLIGTTAESFHDYLSTPYSAGYWPYQEMPGVLIQAHMVSQILSAVLDDRPLIWVFPNWGDILWIWIWSVAGATIALHIQSASNLGIAGISTLGILYGICFGIFIHGGWVPFVPSVLVLVTTSGSVTAYIKFQTKNIL
ncbi:MAG: CHASE2 domain-containing protein [Scytonema sp. PMC 1069.18]|nr:CHASE2 domain-containing protein [Scytonema sp. PMC 1069.18]MEC4884545.1 CHASE2 domain-containing protein [Scytonema sp. PMC 1070.18]